MIVKVKGSEIESIEFFKNRPLKNGEFFVPENIDLEDLYFFLSNNGDIASSSFSIKENIDDEFYLFDINTIYLFKEKEFIDLIEI
jgi:hypothetical protein